ncbi:MAG: cytochrome P450 [Gammaproteobacteria bacterium]|nr:cytochrome P450 [Gammaproteobacteria bacterium]
MQYPTDESITIDQLVNDPYPIYKRLRAESPVLYVPAVRRILITKAKDTQAIKMNPELFSSDDPNTPMERAFGAKTLMRRDGDDHMRLRKAMMPSMSPGQVKKVWSDQIEQIAAEYIDRLPKGETIDFFSAFAAPFSARCVAVVLGIPQASDSDIARWSQVLIDGAGNFGGLPELFEQTDAANEEMNACLAQAIASPDKNFEYSALGIQTQVADPIEYEHIVSNIKIAIGGGINEPRDSLMTALFGLLTNPEQRDAAVNDPSLFSQAFEESVRWVAPIQASSRLVTSDTTIRDFDIEKGSVVMTIQASANRDEEVYDNADAYDLFRKNKRHQGFGNGPHFCMGTHLSRRMIGDIALPMLFDRFPSMALTNPDDVQWRGFGFRGPINLPITLH